MAEVPLAVLTKFIASFGGGSALAVETFVKNCSVAMELATSQQKSALLHFIKSQIGGKAGHFITGKKFENWEALKKVLLETFPTPKKNLSHLILELLTSKQGKNETVHEFAQRIKKCIEDVTHLVNSEALNGGHLIDKLGFDSYLAGLKSEIRSIVRAKDPKSIDEAKELAEIEERITNFINHTDKTSSSSDTRTDPAKPSTANNHSADGDDTPPCCECCKKWKIEREAGTNNIGSINVKF